MSALPIRRPQFALPKFAAWLVENGAEIAPPTNPYEVIRYKAYAGGKKAVTHIVYSKDTGLLTWTGASAVHYTAFLSGEAMTLPKPPKPAKATPVAYPPEPAITATAKRRQRLLKRDGDGCWFCAEPMGSDCTLEHLVPQSRGGGNDDANCVLAHAKCNGMAANLSISEKVAFRARMRAGVDA